ncbi:MAG: (d)CMP kinase [Anaerovoracaceae bacterium]
MIRVAIDGPGGAGKSTIAKKVANMLNIDYIDTGAMYRAVAYKMINAGVEINAIPALISMLENTKIDFDKGATILDREDISSKIRTPEISKMASAASALLPVREKLVALQKEIAQSKSVVMDGRDIGTNVIPDAEYKFFMTATPEIRAKRRYLELQEKGQNIGYSQVLEDILERDHNDTTRKHNPLRMAEDAIEIETTDMTIEEVTRLIIDEVGNGSC